MKAFANPPGEPEGDFAPSLRAALFLLNDPVWLDLLQPKDGNLIDRLNKLDDARAVADELYLSVLTRRPTDEERAEIVELLARQGDRRSTAIVDLAWSLLASTEFCINH